MNTKLLRSSAPSLGAAAGAVLAVTFLPHGVAGAEPEVDLVWYRDFGALTLTSETNNAFDIEQVGYGPLNGLNFSSAPIGDIVLPDELQADQTANFLPWLDDYEIATYDVTVGDAAIPTGSVIDLSLSPTLSTGTETIEIPGAGLFGLPEIVETFFSPMGSFSI
jgi:hypothetical protein